MGESCHVSGWGLTQHGSTSPILKEAGVSTMNHDYCRVCTYDGFKVVESLEFCAGSLDRDGNGLLDVGDDSSLGDSGGPLTCVRNGQPELAGVVSWGGASASQIDGQPSVYVNVRAYRK